MLLELLREQRFLLCIILSAAGYLSGSVHYAEILVRRVTGENVRIYGDGNPGAYNTGLACGVKYGILCGMMDLLKAAVPVMIACRYFLLSDWLLLPICLAPHLGHRHPVKRYSEGGIGITTAFGGLIGLIPASWLALYWAICILVLLPFRLDHARLMTGSVLLFYVLLFCLRPPIAVWLAAIVLSGTIALHFLQIIRKEDSAE